MIRPTDKVILDLKILIHSKGYIYALCLILFEDFHHDLEKIHLIDPHSKLSVKESSLILGFLVQHPIDLTIPGDPEEVIAMKEKTYELAKELQMSYSAPQFDQLREMLEKQESGEIFPDTKDDKRNFFMKNGAVIEPTFYAGDGVYDFQYLEYLERKYKYDQDWLSQNKNFKIDEVCKVVKGIKNILQEKAKQVNLVNLDENFPNIMEKARKKLTKLCSKAEFEKIKRQQYIAATFFQYQELFPLMDRAEKDTIQKWQAFYHNLLELFIVRKSDFTEVAGIDDFFQNFSFVSGGNSEYQGPGHYNVLNSHPLIRLDDVRYFVPINYLVAEAVYETPFYWMWDDKNYRNQLAKHRGDVGEEMTFDFLSKVFGEENTFKSVLVTSKKGLVKTDIDVLCLLGNKALCVQVKSKKMTLMAKRGNSEQLSKDFKGAIQDAYDQGIVSRTSILDKNVRFVNIKGEDIQQLRKEINEVYIMGLTTENYPSLVHQVHMMLDKQADEPAPLFISMFDLELLCHYLPGPYDFLYYVRQRVALIDYWHAAEELVYLGYHLNQKLWPMKGYDGGMLDTDFGANIDRNYYPFKTGLSHLMSEKSDPIHNRWKPKKFEVLLNSIKNSNHPDATDIIFHLMDFSSDAQENMVTAMMEYKQKAISENSGKSLTTFSAPDFGLSYVVSEKLNPHELETKTEVYSTLRKYKSKCDAWLGMGSYTRSAKLVDFIFYLDDTWKFDANIAAKCEHFFGPKNPGIMVPLGKQEKIGRNESCPCNSGLKFKKCCSKK